MQDPKETLNNIDHNTEMALLQSEKIANSVDSLEPIMEGMLVKTDEIVEELKKSNEKKPIESPKIKIEGGEVVTLKGRDGKDGEKGEKGEKGDKGEKGERGEKGEAGKDGLDGMPGDHGFDGKDGRDGINGLPGMQGKAGRDGKDGRDGVDGKDGSPDTGEQIKSKLEKLKVGLDYDSLSNVPDIAKIARNNSSKTVSLTELDDVDYSGLTRTNNKYVLGSSSAITSVVHDTTLSGLGTTASPLKVVGGSPIDDTQIAVRVATTAALAGTWTYNNGTAGVGATLTRTTNGVLPNQDGVSLEVGDRILVKNQSSTLTNGIYEVTQKGVASVSPTILTRSSDADTTQELDEMIVAASEGTTNRAISYGQQTNNPTIGTSAITFTAAPSVALSQATTGTQAINQIPLYTGTARQVTRGTANFKYNPLTDTITIRGADMLFPTTNASGPLTNDGSGTLSWGNTITEGAPTQADRASVDITVLNTDYNQLIGTQLKFGTVPNQQIFEFYPRGGTAPTAPIIGVDLVYNPASNSLQKLSSTLGIQDGDTITINGRTYTWQSTLTNINNHVQLGLLDDESIQNMIDAINLTGTPGTQYASVMTINADVSASSNLTITANIPGTGGNSITTTASISSGDYDWQNATLVGGINVTINDTAESINNSISRNAILADNKVMEATYSSGDTLTVYVVRPGTYGNNIAIDSTNDIAITPSSSTTTGGLNNGTTGSIGAVRKGVITVTNRGITYYLDSIFQAIDTNVWAILSSSQNSNVTDMYSWTNI